MSSNRGKTSTDMLKKLLIYSVCMCQDQFLGEMISNNLVVVMNQALLETQSTVQVFPAVSVCDGGENVGNNEEKTRESWEG